MKIIGEVLSIFISTEEGPSPLLKKEIAVDTKGIVEDKHYNTEIMRSILITSIQSYELLQNHQITTPYGTLGENLLIDFNPYSLPIGTKLQVGDSILEITQNCTLCKHLAKVDRRVPKLLKDDRGIFGKVVREGTIKHGDSISFVD